METNWEAIGAVSELLGAIAVVATLLYLARETGKNARAVDATSLREVAFRLSEWHRHVSDSSTLKAIVQKSQSSSQQEYTPEEWYEFHATALSLFLIYQTQYMHGSLSVGSKEETDHYLRLARGMTQSWPAWQRWWSDMVDVRGLDAGFIEAVENVTDFSTLKSIRQARGESVNA
jgi:hypothetical protein